MAKEKVNASPTKRFFVEMLTRDIDLEDAILDLIDNCIDGVVRELKRLKKRKSGKPYQGYYAEIELSTERFQIKDNCGGIAKKIAKDSAFMLGRPDLAHDKDIETVGMYGIGMKRAIFKMGRQCTVLSQHVGKAYEVKINTSWFSDGKKKVDWELPLQNTTKQLEEDGTRISISRLLEPISKSFDEENSPFIGHLRKEISRLYALIIGKGFRVTINGEPIEPVDLTILSPVVVKASSRKSIEPYLFKGKVEGVNVELAVGFTRRLASEKEIDSDMRQRRRDRGAGWTVICNDRVVLHADTSRLTGWGTATVPSFHNQFNTISGILVFKSNDSYRLPLKTTKRGIETSSPVYLYMLDVMREGTKVFTSFTNKWKTREDETSQEFSKLEPRRPADIIASVPKSKWKAVRRGGSTVKAQKVIPDLPQPKTKGAKRKIIFSRKKSDIELVADYLFDDSTVAPSEVGSRCFDECLKEANE